MIGPQMIDFDWLADDMVVPSSITGCPDQLQGKPDPFNVSTSCYDDMLIMR